MSDEEIDRYAVQRLPDGRRRAFEEHYFECRECLERVQLVSDVVHGLRALAGRRPSHRYVGIAAVLATLCAGLLGWNYSLRQDLDVARRPQGHRPPPSTPQRTPEPAEPPPATRLVHLESPSRSATRTTLRVPVAAELVRLSIDARDAGPPGTPFEVTLVSPRGKAVLRAEGIASRSDGTLELAVPAWLLVAGEHSVVLGSGTEALEIPFVVVR